MLDFQPAVLSDAAIWKRFRSELYDDLNLAHNETEIKRITKDPDLVSYLVFMKNETLPIGLVELSLRNIVDGCTSSPVAYLDGLYLIEKYRGRGLGREMLTFIKNWAKGQGCTELAVDTELENVRAQRFYLREGFKETFRIVQFRMGL